MKTIRLIILMLLIVSPVALSQDKEFRWQIGEELTYKVKWSFIRLGTLRLLVDDITTIDDTPLYHVRLHIDSNPVLFFVNMHSEYESFIDDQLRVRLFLADEKIDNIVYKTEYRFDYNNKIIHAQYTSMKDPTQTIIKEIKFDDLIVDGTGMVFYARSNLHHTRTDTLTSLFEANFGKVMINFKGKKGNIKIDALPKSFETYYADGVVEMKAIAGLTGPFKGWFATDEQRPPLKAEMKVFIGSVIVELEAWKNWTPYF